MPNKTKTNRRMADYNKFMTRKKIFLPAVPAGVPKVGYQSSETTTISLWSIGDQTRKLADINSIHVIAPELTAQNDEHCIWWKVPDDFYSGEDTHVWLVWSPTETTSDGYKNSYAVWYNPEPILDYDQKAVGTSEPMLEAATALDTEISTTVAMADLKLYAAYRSNRGTINGAKLQTEDIVTFKIDAPSNPTNLATIAVLGLEIDYGQRLREPTIETYE
ncbi:MAG: hypothetical protein KAS32_00855 [Candidatus Peribacteraceae bacterium]|nr:hypothetical protein [Candidatus Peribacteraceae bacterium]